MRQYWFVCMVLCTITALAVGAGDERLSRITVDALLDPSPLTPRQELAQVKSKLTELRGQLETKHNSLSSEVTIDKRQFSRPPQLSSRIRRESKSDLQRTAVSEAKNRWDDVPAFDNKESVGGVRIAVFLATVAALGFLAIANSIHYVMDHFVDS